MQLLNKADAKVYEIFDITYDPYGDPQFLIYKNNRWVLVSAASFTPNYEQVFYKGRDAYLDENEELIQSGE